MRIKNLLLIAACIILLTALKASAAPCCANPISQAPLCIESERYITPETCCGDNFYFGKVEGAPKNDYDCSANFFSSTGCRELGDKCAIGCCLRQADNVCQDNTPGILCGGKFSAVFNGLCIKNGTYAIEDCQKKSATPKPKGSGINNTLITYSGQKACCCTGTTGVLTLKEGCSQIFYQTLTSAADCSSACAGKTTNTIAAKINRSKACTDLADKTECINNNCYWCPESGCGFDCTACTYQYDSFPETPDHVCDDICLGMVCGEGYFCNAGRCLPQFKTSNFSLKAFFTIFALILLIVAFIISSKIRSEK